MKRKHKKNKSMAFITGMLCLVLLLVVLLDCLEVVVRNVRLKKLLKKLIGNVRLLQAMNVFFKMNLNYPTLLNKKMLLIYMVTLISQVLPVIKTMLTSVVTQFNLLFKALRLVMLILVLLLVELLLVVVEDLNVNVVVVKLNVMLMVV